MRKMMKIQTIHSEKAPKAIGPYSQARTFCNLIFCSGQIALTGAGEDFTQSDVPTQTRIAMENLSAVLNKAGSSLERALKVTIYLIDMADFDLVNQEYAKFFSDNPPARATVAVSALPRGARVEIDCIAAMNDC